MRMSRMLCFALAGLLALAAIAGCPAARAAAEALGIDATPGAPEIWENPLEGSASEGEDAPIVPTDGALYTYADMERDLRRLQARYPERLRVRSVGTSLDGRSIYEATLGDPEAEKHILIQASIHGREHMNTLLAMRQLEQALAHCDAAEFHGVACRELFANFCFHVLPMTNPDGVTISQLGPDGIRSARLRSIIESCRLLDGGGEDASYWQRWKANARGVDLNRNFDSGWQLYVGADHPSSEHYKGASPASEPEVQAILRAAEACAPICTISYHSMGNAILWDYGCAGDAYQPERALADAAARLTGYPPRATFNTAEDAGGCSNYFALERGIPSITIENGSVDCPLPASEFAAIWRANENLWPALAELFSAPVPISPSGAMLPDSGMEYSGYVIGRHYRAGVEEFLTLRAEPSTSGRELRKLGADTDLQLLEFANESFCLVRVVETNELGYVMTRYLY